jgi:Alpha-L-arabinofuranosidase B (ABFB) domain
MDVVNLRAANLPDHFIRHRAFLGELTRQDAIIADFAFTLVPRGPHHVRLRSRNFPTRYLRHRDFRIRLEEPAGPGDELFLADSTFRVVPGLADPAGMSLQSLNFPDRFLRHRDFHLVLEPRDSPNLAADATWFRQPAAVLIDEGPVLVPVDD